jgi:hypothetical protein
MALPYSQPISKNTRQKNLNLNLTLRNIYQLWIIPLSYLKRKKEKNPKPHKLFFGVGG